MALRITQVSSPHHAAAASTPSACTPTCETMSFCTGNPAPPRATAPNTPVSKLPSTPPTPCTGETSSESSISSLRLSSCVAKKHTKPAHAPMTMAPSGPTKPDAGVIVPKPATMPVTTPSIDGLPYFFHSIIIHASAPADAPMCVVNIAMPAEPFAASALPALKPNQPTHSMPAPVTAYGRLCGAIAVCGKPRRLPSTSAQTSAATPALTCTTMPPAKSMTPSLASQPPPQTQCAMGT